MNANRSRTRTRRGYGLADIAVAAMVVVVAMGVTVKVLGWVAADRRAADRRDWALQAVSNVLERVGSEPFDRVTAESVKAIAAATTRDRGLPEPTWDVDVEDDRDAPVRGRRVSLRLRWKERSGGWGTPVRLTSWVYDRGARK